jgi:hypothetical protein
MRSTAMSLPASVLLLAASVLLPLVTFSAAYAVSQVHNPEVWLRKGYFLSAAIDLPPASNFGSLGLTLTLAAFTGVVIVRHHVVAARLALLAPQQDSHQHASIIALHRASLTTALTAAFGGHGVAAYQHTSNSRVHNGFAATFVLCALFHFAMESLVERRAGLSSRLARATRLILVVISSLACATFISHVIVEETLRTPIGIGKWRAALAEILTCLCFIVYIATYSRSFHETSLTLSVSYTPGMPVNARPPSQSSSTAAHPGAPSASSPLGVAKEGGAAAPDAMPATSSSRLFAAEGLLAAAPARLRRCLSDTFDTRR